MEMCSAMTAVHDYWQDAWQRSILFLDVLRERGNIYLEHSTKQVPHVLSFKVELVPLHRSFDRLHARLPRSGYQAWSSPARYSRFRPYPAVGGPVMHLGTGHSAL